MKNILRENMKRFGTKNLLTEQATESYEIGGLSVSKMMAASTTGEGYERLVFKAKHTNTDYATTDPEATCKLLVQVGLKSALTGPMYTIVSLACTSGKDFDAGTKDAPGKGKVDSNFEQTIEGKITSQGTKKLFKIIKN
jgi:hypothetical protein